MLKTSFLKPFIFLAQLLSVLALILFIGTSAFLTKIYFSPFDLTRFQNHEKVQNILGNKRIKADTLILNWDGIGTPFYITGKNINLRENGASLISLNMAEIQIQAFPLLWGKIHISSIRVEDSNIMLRRAEDGQIYLGLVDKEAEKTQDFDVKRLLAGSVIPDFLGNIGEFSLTNTKIILDDAFEGKTSITYLPELVFTEQDGRYRLLMILERPGKAEPNRIDLYLNTNNNNEAFEIADVPLDILSEFGILPRKMLLDGNINLGIKFLKSPNGKIIDAIQFYGFGHNIAFNTGRVGAETGIITKFNFEGLYDAPNKNLVLRPVDLTIDDTNILLGTDIRIQERGVAAQILIQSPKGDIEKFDKYLPVDHLNPEDIEKVEKWLILKIQSGTYKDLNIGFNLYYNPDAENEDDIIKIPVEEVTGSFAFSESKIDYKTPLPIASEVSGFGEIKNDDLKLTLEKGKVGDIKISETSIIALTDLSIKGGGVVDLDLNLSGPLPSALNYIATKPIEAINKKEDIDPSKTKGKLDLALKISFPAIKGDIAFEDVKIVANGTLSAAEIQDIAKGLDLSGGPFSLKIEDGLLELDGKGQLDNTPVHLSYNAALNRLYRPEVKTRLDADIAATPDILTKLGLDLSDYWSGIAQTKINYVEDWDNAATVIIDADLKNAAIRYTPLNIEKSMSRNLRLKADLTLKNEIAQRFNITSLMGNGMHLKKGHLRFTPNGQDIAKATIDDFIIGRNKVNIDYLLKDSKNAALYLTGPSIDLSALIKGGISQDKQDHSQIVKTQINLQAGRLHTSQNGFFENVEGIITLSPQDDIKDMDFTAMAGRGPISIRYIDQAGGGRLRLQVEAADAGAALKAIGLNEDIRGGRLRILAMTERGQRIKGLAQITNFSVVNAPAIAKLLNAISFSGIDDLVQGEGISFDLLRSDFTWDKTPSGKALITLKNGRTSGSEVGFTFNGEINQTDKIVNIDGTMVPLSTINSFIKNIPLVGNILTGGEGIIGVRYGLKGPFDDIRTSVNPLSALTPGILRSLLFESDNDTTFDKEFGQNDRFND